MHKSVRPSHVMPAAPVISLHQPGRLRTANVLALMGWSHSTLYARIADGKFPKPKKDGARNYWTTGEVLPFVLEEGGGDGANNA